MNRLLHLACAGIVLATSTVAAQVGKYEWGESEISAIEFSATNYGLIGLNADGRPVFDYPRESGKSYMFGGGLWFGVTKMVNQQRKKLVFITYNPGSGVSWGKPGEGTQPVPPLEDAYAMSYNSTHFSPITGECLLRDGFYPTWPLWLRPGEEARPMTPGTFERYDERRTVVGGTYDGLAYVPGVHEQIVCRFHDGDLTRYELVGSEELAGYPIGLQFQQNIYAWEEGIYKGVVMVQYQIINLSNDTLRDCVVGQISDPDLGNADNDHTRYYSEHPQLRAAYAWSEPTSGDNYGALAMTIIEGPVAGESGFIDNRRRYDYMMQGRIGTFPDWSDGIDPVTQEARYDYMTSGDLASDTGPSDKRALLATTKFNMYPGDTCHFTMAYVILRGVPEMGKTVSKDDRTTIVGTSVAADELEGMVQALLEDYYVFGLFRSGIVSAATPDLPEAISAVTATPNPAANSTTIDFTLSAGSNVKIRLANTLGETVFLKDSGTLPAGAHSERIELGSLPPGLYIVTIETGRATTTTKLILAR